MAKVFSRRAAYSWPPSTNSGNNGHNSIHMNSTHRITLSTIRWCLYALVVAVPLFFYQHVMNPFIVPKTVLFEILVEVMFALWLALAITHKKYRPRLNVLSAVLLAFAGVLTATAAFGADFQSSVWSTPARALGLFALWHFVALFFVLASLGRDIDWRKVWWVSLATSVVASLEAILSVYSSFLRAEFLEQGFDRPGGLAHAVHPPRTMRASMNASFEQFFNAVSKVSG